MKVLENKSLKTVKRIIVAIIGFTVLIIGMAMIVLPGPAIIVIPLGLAILASEFLWARRLLKKIKNTLRRKKEEDKHGREAE
jgi:tellurite resistance protein TerC